MRVLHVIPGFTIRGGGGNRACAELCESLAALGLSVSVAHLQDGSEPCFAPKGVNVRSFPSLVKAGYGYSPSLKRYLREEIPQHDIVHVHATWRYPGVAASRVAQETGTPYVVQPHGNLHPWKLRHKGLRKRLYWHLIEKHILTRAAFVHAESAEDMCDIQACLPRSRVIVSPCGCFSDRFHDKGPAEYFEERWPLVRGKKMILFLGRVDVNKGVDLLIKAFANLSHIAGDYVLFIVGPDYSATTARMNKLAKTIGIDQRILWAGMVSEQERIWILHRCDIYTLPSLSENFGISILEAMFCAKPVLTTRATPWAILEEIRAGVVTEPTYAGVREGLRDMVAMSDLDREAMGQNGHKFARRCYEWHDIACDLVKRYEYVIKAAKDK